MMPALSASLLTAAQAPPVTLGPARPGLTLTRPDPETEMRTGENKQTCAGAPMITHQENMEPQNMQKLRFCGVL